MSLPQRGQRHSLPLISWVNEAADPYAPGNAETWIDFDGPCSSSSFALRVRGISMVNPSGEEPTFPDGCIIGVDPRRRPKSFEFAVFRFNNTDEATFKQYVADGPLKMLRPLNPTFPVITVRVSYMTTSEGWRYLRCPFMFILVEGKPVKIPDSKHSGNVVSGRTVLEDVYVEIPWATFKTIAAAKSVEMKVCNDAFTIPERRLDDWRELVRLMTP